MNIVERAFCVLVLLVLSLCIHNLFKVFERMPARGNDKGWVSLAIILEVAVLIFVGVSLVLG